MFPGWILAVISLSYTGLLFAIAWFGDRLPKQHRFQHSGPWLYSLTLAIYCTSWTFFGAVGQAVNNGWDFLPIYLGPILVFLFASPLLFKMLAICKQEGITSIADFIASRYGKSQPLAICVTLIAIIGIIPYITLQLKAVTMAFHTLGSPMSDSAPDITLLLALIMALFSILFGTRRINATEHQYGLMLAVGFESLVKLFAFVCIGVFVIWIMFGGIIGFWNQMHEHPLTAEKFTSPFFDQGFFTQTLIAMTAIICLPRQFHTTFVENRNSMDLQAAKWIFSFYLLLFSLFVVPIAVAGMTFLPEHLHHADRYILLLPAEFQYPSLALLGFLGGVSAATGMVIVSSVALSIMICNELIMPFYLTKRPTRLPTAITPFIRRIRRISILCLLLLAYGLSTLFTQANALANIGLLSFSAVCQFAPALIGGLYWKQGHRYGAAAGLMAGFMVWFYCLFLPIVLPSGLLEQLHQHGLFALGILKPHALLGLEGLDPLTHGVFWSLLCNITGYIYVSKAAKHHPIDRHQATLFVDTPTHYELLISRYQSTPVLTQDLMQLAERCLGKGTAYTHLQTFATTHNIKLDPRLPASIELFRHVEKMLAQIMGAGSSRILLGSILNKHRPAFGSSIAMMDEAAELIQFNHQLLQTTFETITHGICVVDQQLNIVAWNSMYIQLFDYPEGLIQLGRPIESIYRYNASRHFYGPNADQQVQRRLKLLQMGKTHRFERELPNGRFIEVRGNPMPGGGFVSSYLDITESKMDERALRELNDSLEIMVHDRTQKLQQLNKALQKANESKTRFLAAAGHDLMQPLNATHLFVASLTQQLKKSAHADSLDNAFQLLRHIDQSLHVAEHLIHTLLDISRLDTGIIQPQINRFPVSSMLSNLATEFQALANEKNLTFRWVDSQTWIRSDDKLLRRVLQNLLLNAIRYTPSGRILMGCRRHKHYIAIQIWDTGIGIPADQQDLIFKEFHRIKSNHDALTEDNNGLGLGLAISHRICQLLHHTITVESRLGAGTVFSVQVPIVPPLTTAGNAPAPSPSPAPVSLNGIQVLCVDNEPMMLNSLENLVSQWGCQCLTAQSMSGAIAVARQTIQPPDLLLIDYQLNHETGFDVIDALDDEWEDVIPVILMTANPDQIIKEKARQRGYHLLPKPISADALHQAIRTLLSIF